MSSGDVFGFRQASVDSIFGPGVTSGSDFSTPGESSAPVPEPTSLALLGIGLGALATRRRRRG